MLCKDMSPFTILNLNFPKNLCAAQIITSNDLGWRQKSLRRTSKPAFPLSHSFTRQTKGGLWGMWTRKKKRSCSASKVRSSSGWERAGQPGGVLMLRLNQEVVGQTRCALTPPRSRRKSKHAGDGEAGKSTWRKTSAALFMHHLRAVYEVR